MEKRMVIMGATSGIGYEVAKIYQKRGYRLGLAGRRLDRLKKIQANNLEQIKIKQIDVTTQEAPRLLNELIQELGGMDLFLLCSGIGSQNQALTNEIELATIQTNAAGFAQMVLTAYHYFERQGKGHIAVISSIAGTKGLGVAPAYSATKGFQNIYIDALSQLTHMTKKKILFTDIRPGFVKTDLLKDGRDYPMLLTPQYAAQQIAKAIDLKKRKAIIDRKYAILVFFWRLLPEWIWERLPIRN